MRQLTYRDDAVDDLGAILEYVARESGNEAVGRQFINRLQEHCRRLASLPGTLGRPRDELRPGLRSSAILGYVVLFRYVGDTLLVVCILEGHRDVTAVLDSRGP